VKSNIVLRSQIGLQLGRFGWRGGTYSAWEMIRENIQITAKESLGYFEWKKHKPLFNE
jgi:hypothetical protein